jgi:hypothetical protein
MQSFYSINIYVIIISIFLFANCKKEELPIAPNVQTKEAINPRATSATLQGFNASESLLGITERGFFYADHNKPAELLKQKVIASPGNSYCAGSAQPSKS